MVTNKRANIIKCGKNVNKNIVLKNMLFTGRRRVFRHFTRIAVSRGE